MTTSKLKILACTGMAMGILMSTLPVMADNSAVPPTAVPAGNASNWRKTHPARAKDNARIRNQRKLLKQDLASGKISQDQYNAQMKELRTIKREERSDARANENGGHLTGGQQQAINSQLNESRKDINQEVQGGQPK